ncbi:MAG: hypothetical protein IKU88_06190 [Alistipes sp.]|nr:hypothetical protein [Alistipes sp.]
MKKFLILMATIGLLCACQKEEITTPEDVTFNLSYTLDKGSCMTRAGADLYASFYENFVKTKKVGYPNYKLTFYKDEKEVGTFSGEWDATLVTLPEGTYTIKGTSKSSLYGIYSKRENEHLKNMSLSFEEEITISKNTKTLTLNPTYACHLVFVDAALFSKISVSGTHTDVTTIISGHTPIANCDFFDAADVKYIFLNGDTSINNISYKTIDGDEGVLTISTLGFENGNYYCLDAIATGYQVPPMNNGF